MKQRAIGDGLSRRSFVAGAFAALGAGLAVSSLGGCSPKGAGQADSTSGAIKVPDSVVAPSEFETISTDVLVIGAGAAGTEAAIAAANAGASVIVIDKKAFGHCGDSGLHYSGRMTSSEFEVDGDSPDEQLRDAVDTGRYIVDQDMGKQVLQAYHDDAVLMKSENYGDIHFRDADTGKPFIDYSSSKPRLWIGFKLGNMAYRALERGVRVMDYCTATKLLTDENGSVVGATVVDFKTGSFRVIRAKGTILATGGETGIWGAGTVAAKYGGGAYNLTGDGHSLAAAVGAEFRDLEFRSLYMYMGPIAPSSISNLCCTYASDLSTYKDADGTRMFADDEIADMTLRGAMSAFEKTLQEGKGGPNGGVYATLGAVDKGNNTGGGLLDREFLPDVFDQIKIHWEKQGTSMEDMEVAPQFTYDYGGIVTNFSAETGIDGLYACGECAMHCGAQYRVFRMFSSASVMGKRAGESAAARAKSVAGGMASRDVVEGEYLRVYGLLYQEPSDPVSVKELKRRIMDSAWKGSGALRSDRKCGEALDELAEAETSLEKVRVSDKSTVCNIEWMEALELANMIRIARMDTMASRARTESRGTHLRNEYPEEDNDNWIKNVYVREQEGELVVDVRPAVVTDYPAPGGKVHQGGDILEDY